MKSARIYLASLLALSLFPSVASATCGTGNPSSYDDITAVMLTGEPYGHFIRRCSGTSPCFNNPTTLAGSWFWALFGSAPDYQTTTFTDYDLKRSIGTFQLGATLSDALAVLRRYDFFSLSPHDSNPDVGLQVLSVKRCAVVTTIPLYDTGPEDQDPATLRLFNDLDTLIAGAKRVKISGKPQRFNDIFLFNP